VGAVVSEISDSPDNTVKSVYKPGRLYRDEGNDLWVAIEDSLGNVGVIPLLREDGVWVDDVSDIFKGCRRNVVSAEMVPFFIKTT
jgi:hypothetical protein